MAHRTVLAFSLGLAVSLPTAAPAHAASRPVLAVPFNLIANPGFEKNRLVTIRADGPEPWAELLKRGVDLPAGDTVPMPFSWGLNPSDGWIKGHGAVYRYVTGTAGQEVHAGEHAVFLAVKGSAVSLVAGGVIRVIENFTAAEKKKALPLKTPFPFSFYAKGKGTVAGRLYTYPFAKENYGLYKVTPAQFTITEQWQKYQGTLEFTDPGQFTEPGRVADSGASFVLMVSDGEVTLDDITLFNVLPAAPVSSGKVIGTSEPEE